MDFVHEISVGLCKVQKALYKIQRHHHASYVILIFFLKLLENVLVNETSM